MGEVLIPLGITPSYCTILYLEDELRMHNCHVYDNNSIVFIQIRILIFDSQLYTVKNHT